MSQPLIFAVDIGNHRIKIAPIRPPGEGAESWALGRMRAFLHSAPFQELESELVGRTAWWLICSVQQARADAFERWIAARPTGDRWLRLASGDVPLQIDVEQPHRVGVDRLCAVAGARTLADRHPLIVIDAGSAVTVDAASAGGDFLGGTIFLGLQGELDCLARVGSALPSLELPDRGQVVGPIGKSTEQAILAGVVLSTAGGITEIVGQMSRILGGVETGEPRVFLTGGDADFLQRWLRFQHLRVDDLVLRGVLESGLPWLATELGSYG